MAYLAYNAGMKMSQQKKYTIRNVTDQVDKRLRESSRQERKSLNEIVLRALERGAGVAGEPPAYTDLDFLIGTWKDDPQFDEAIRQQDIVDPKLWS